MATGANVTRIAIFLAGLLLAVILAAPGATVTSKYLNDLFIFLDGAHRIVSGQVPNVDFRTSLGPLSFYIPAAGYALTGNFGSAMPLGMALLVAIFGVMAAEVIGSRMRLVIGLPLGLYLLLILAAPINPGEVIGELTFAMFYNRIGWAALGLLFVFYLPRREGERRRDVVDAVIAALLVLLMLYTKMTYGLAALGFLVFMLTDTRQARWVMFSLAAVVLSVVVIELFWGGGRGHIADLRLASDVSGGLPAGKLRDVLLRNTTDLGFFALFAVLLVVARRRVRDGLFVFFCLATGLLIIEQNFQIVGIMTLVAAVAIGSQLLFDETRRSPSPLLVAGLPLVAGFMMVPASIGNAASLGLHAVMAIGGQGEPIPLSQFADVRLVPTIGPGPFGRFHRYNEAIAEGGAALSQLDPPAGRVVVMDFANPFSAGLGLAPARGDSPWYHWGRTIDAQHFPPAEEIFADADILMQPKVPIERYTGQGMAALYADYVTAHYRLIADTKEWRLYRRLPSAVPSASATP